MVLLHSKVVVIYQKLKFSKGELIYYRFKSVKNHFHCRKLLWYWFLNYHPFYWIRSSTLIFFLFYIDCLQSRQILLSLWLWPYSWLWSMPFMMTTPWSTNFWCLPRTQKTQSQRLLKLCLKFRDKIVSWSTEKYQFQRILISSDAWRFHAYILMTLVHNWILKRKS